MKKTKMSKLKINIAEINFYFENIEDLQKAIKKILDEKEKKYLELKTDFTKIKKQIKLLNAALLKFSETKIPNL